MADRGRFAAFLFTLLGLAVATCGIARAAADNALQEPGGINTACD